MAYPWHEATTDELVGKKIVHTEFKEDGHIYINTDKGTFWIYRDADNNLKIFKWKGD